MVETQLPPPKEAKRSPYVLRLWEARDFSRVRLHKNYRSTQRKNQYRPELWGLVPDDMKVLYGIDAHSVEEMTEGYLYWKEKKGEQ